MPATRHSPAGRAPHTGAPFARVVAALCAGLVSACCVAYYGVVAFAPALLAGTIAGVPFSIVVVLVLFGVFFGLTLVYSLWAPHAPDTDQASAAAHAAAAEQQ